jgi:hypothetical protein
MRIIFFKNCQHANPYMDTYKQALDTLNFSQGKCTPSSTTSRPPTVSNNQILVQRLHKVKTMAHKYLEIQTDAQDNNLAYTPFVPNSSRFSSRFLCPYSYE